MKQVILIRTDLKMSKGKIATQAAHACVLATLKSSQNTIEEWEKQGMTKIALAVENLAELNKLIKKAQDLNIMALTVEDDGLTEFTEPTITCGVIGPEKCGCG